MQEIPTEENDTLDAASELKEKENLSQAQGIVPTRSRESLWGAVLFAGMLLFVVASIGGVGRAAYIEWQGERAEKRQRAIMGLQEQSNEQRSVTPKEEARAVGSTEAKEQPASDNITAAKKLEISVLNGGAAKGSAGTLANFLKQEGYGKTDSGNTLKDYSSVALYYASGLEKEALSVKESVAKKYPQAKILPADSQNKETSVSQITIILGK